jgi:hypothetical protein
MYNVFIRSRITGSGGKFGAASMKFAAVDVHGLVFEKLPDN